MALQNEHTEHNEDNSDSIVDDIANGQKVERTDAGLEDISKESYVPVNFISDEVYALIAAWEASSLATSSDGIDIENASVPLVSASRNNIEPTRHIDDFTPPKRFYRTFWSSISKRIIASSRSQTI